jgi:hypothetical protein
MYGCSIEEGIIRWLDTQKYKFILIYPLALDFLYHNTQEGEGG